VNAKEFPARLHKAQKDVAERLERDSRKFVAARMLWDSPSERLKFMHRVLTSFPELPPWMTPEVKKYSLEAHFDLADFQDNKSRINVNCVSVLVSKSGSVFFPALDELDEAAKSIQWPATAWDFWAVSRALTQSHAFDDGNKKAVTWIDGQRSDVLSKTDPYFQLRLSSTMKPLEVVESTESIFVQAADIAAGIVSAIWDQQTLVHAVRAFEYLTYNGKRISESDAVAITARLDRSQS
jgi:hypothetical protein